MRGVQIFAGNSHPHLAHNICERLGIIPGSCELSSFSNGETSVNIGTSIRDQDVFIVQSGSTRTNDSIMELLIMIAACKGGSAKSITAVMPYFPYSRQSKKKSHRGAITARMLANLLSVAGMDHIITVDLHAPPMQGFFGKPVDNLQAQSLIARWIRIHVKGWQDAVVVSKGPGGSKRVTSLADALKLSFGIITTDRRRSPREGSLIFDASTTTPTDVAYHGLTNGFHHEINVQTKEHEQDQEPPPHQEPQETSGHPGRLSQDSHSHGDSSRLDLQLSPDLHNTRRPPSSTPLRRPLRSGSASPPSVARSAPRRRSTAPVHALDSDVDPDGEHFTDERAREVITGRLIQGHIVDDNFPSPMLSSMAGSVVTLPSLGTPATALADERSDPMLQSFLSTASSLNLQQQAEHALGGTYGDQELSDQEEDERLKNPELEHTITLVGDVSGRTVIIVDDILDRAETWVAAAETLVKRGGATQVYCMATHGLFGEDALEELQACDCIDHVVVCNTFPIDMEKAAKAEKLVILDLAGMLAEAIRRNHYGESISKLYQYYDDI